MQRRYLLFFVGIVLFAVFGAGVILFSSQAAVAVHFTSSNDQALEITVDQPTIQVASGETQRVRYRVTNPGNEPRNVIANLEYEPANSEFQVRIFQTDCGQWTLINPGQTVEFETVFSILPAGPFGADEITLHHVFTKP